MGDWCLIESDPGVFTELIHSVGCDEASMEEVYYLDQLLSDWKHAETFGLVFLFKIDKEGYKSRKDFAQANYSSPKGLFFAQQIIQNACASKFHEMHAVISDVLDSPSNPEYYNELG